MELLFTMNNLAAPTSHRKTAWILAFDGQTLIFYFLFFAFRDKSNATYVCDKGYYGLSKYLN